MSQKIDMTPTWSDVLPLMVEVIRNGEYEGVKIVKEELQRMAKAADLWNAEAKAENENGGK